MVTQTLRYRRIAVGDGPFRKPRPGCTRIRRGPVGTFAAGSDAASRQALQGTPPATHSISPLAPTESRTPR